MLCVAVGLRVGVVCVCRLWLRTVFLLRFNADLFDFDSNLFWWVFTFGCMLFWCFVLGVWWVLFGCLKWFV